MAVKVAINGFGRIGRLAFRQMFGHEGSREFDNLIRYEVHQSQIWLIFLSNLKFILARSTPIRYNSIGG